MSLNTKQRRGSVMGVSLPFRPWTAEPSGDVDYQERLSVLHLCSAIIAETAPPEVPGIEYQWAGDRLQYKWNGSRAHWVWAGDRLHYVAGEEL